MKITQTKFKLPMTELSQPVSEPVSEPAAEPVAEPVPVPQVLSFEDQLRAQIQKDTARLQPFQDLLQILKNRTQLAESEFKEIRKLQNATELLVEEADGKLRELSRNVKQ